MSVPVGKTEKIVLGETYWTSSKAAEHMGVCKNTLLNFCKLGLSHINMGSYKLFKEDWLKEFLTEKSQITIYKRKKK